MGKITEISPQARDKTRVNVYIDGAFVCGLSLETAVKHRLKAGAEIDGERLKEIEAMLRQAVGLAKEYGISLEEIQQILTLFDQEEQ